MLDRNSVLAAGLVVVTLLLGIVSGVAIDRWLLRPPREFAGPGPGRMPAGGERRRFDPGQFREQLSAQLAKELELSAEQRVKVDSILSAQQMKSRELMGEVRPKLQVVAESTQAALRKVLTADQQEELRKLREERMRKVRRGPMREEVRERR